MFPGVEEGEDSTGSTQDAEDDTRTEGSPPLSRNGGQPGEDWTVDEDPGHTFESMWRPLKRSSQEHQGKILRKECLMDGVEEEDESLSS